MQLTSGLLGVAALLMASQANAATVSLTPESNTVSLGETFTLFVGGTGFVNGATAGGANLTWDASVLTLSAVNLASGLQADGTGTGGTYEWISFAASSSPGVFDVAAFYTDSALLGDPFPVTGSTFDFLSLNFTVIAAPAVNPSDVTIFNSVNGVWQDPLGDITGVVFGDATVTVNAVPVPAAVWLFGSGLIGLVGIARRRNPAIA